MLPPLAGHYGGVENDATDAELGGVGQAFVAELTELP
jgi:hypothetical protein